MSMTVITEWISWLINVTDNSDKRWKPENTTTCLCTSYADSAKRYFRRTVLVTNMYL